LDLDSVEPCISGPKRPHDRIPLSNVKKDFTECVPNKPGFKGFGVSQDKIHIKQNFKFNGE
jgi:aconitate hydratase